MSARKPGRAVPLPPVDAAPVPLSACHRLLDEHTGMGGVGAWLWLHARIAEHRAARFEDGMFNPGWVRASSPGPGGDCWLSVTDLAEWLKTAGYDVAHPADAAPRRKGRDTLDVLIEREQRLCFDPRDPVEVWARLLALADSTSPPYPILGRDEGAIKWQSDASEGVKFMTRNALRQRLERQTEAP